MPLVVRRQVLKAFLIGGPTLAVGVRLGLGEGAGAFPTKTDDVPDAVDFTDFFILSQQPTAYDLKIEVRPDNRVYLEAPRMEIGQGMMTTIGMLVAEGLDVPFESLDIVLSPGEPKRANSQITAGSHTTRGLWDPARLVTARMRGQLLAAGAERLGVPVSQLRTEDGFVVATDGRQASYGELTAGAANLPEAAAAGLEDLGSVHDHRKAPRPVRHGEDRARNVRLRHGPARSMVRCRPWWPCRRRMGLRWSRSTIPQPGGSTV